MITNCPNCGAVLKDGKCEFCGTEVRIGVSVNEIARYLNGVYKSEEDGIKQEIKRIEKSIENGNISKYDGLRKIASLRARLIDLKENKPYKI